MSSYDRYESRRRDSSSRRERSPRRESRRSSPGPSRRSPETTKPRNEMELPEQFGRGMEEREEDDFTVLQRMKKSYSNSPLGSIYKCVDGSRKLKVWTRNFKEVRGICTGYVIAFDKHWNLIMTDVDEVYLKPRKAKTPFLAEVRNGSDSMQELPPKVPKQKKKLTEGEEASKADAEPVAPKQSEEQTAAGQTEKKKKRRKKKKGPTTQKRHVKQFFVRGDNIVMVSIMEEETQEVEDKSDED